MPQIYGFVYNLVLIASFDAPSVQIPVFCQASPLRSPGENSKILGDPNGLAWQKPVFGQMGHQSWQSKRVPLWLPLGRFRILTSETPMLLSFGLFQSFGFQQYFITIKKLLNLQLLISV